MCFVLCIFIGVNVVYECIFGMESIIIMYSIINMHNVYVMLK